MIGGGAAGFFAAINIAERQPSWKIAILERGNDILTKVRVSGGGRCNVTHAEFVPKELSQNYPRGEKELLGPFHKFMTGDTIEWFEKRGVELKIEEDGRMFPVSNSSQSIIDCFVSLAHKYKVQILKNQSVKTLQENDGEWLVTTKSDNFQGKKIVMTTGSNPKIWKILEELGHSIIPPVPSLFTFNIKDDRINELPGISTQVSVQVVSETNNVVLESEGPLMVTHWGFSGPAILKLSAWGATELHRMNYNFMIRVNWLYDWSMDAVVERLKEEKSSRGKQTMYKYAQFDLPKRLWHSLLGAAGISKSLKWGEASNIVLQNLSLQLTESYFKVEGKSTFKEEFVTAGGVDLKEVNFRTFNSKIYPTLYFAGEVLNIDAITGGFNFQNAWTGAYIVAQSV